MTDKNKIVSDIQNLKDGETLNFNMFQDGGASCHKQGDTYTLYEIPLYGGKEQYSGVYSEAQIPEMVEEALSWT